MKACSVYWIHHPDHSDMLTQGYIGVSKHFKRRLYEHLKLSRNQHFKNAIAKYGWENLVKKQLVISNQEYCLELEKKLRPTDHLGWNIVAGGGKAPVVYGNTWNKGRPSANKGKSLTEETKNKISKTLIGNVPWNKGKTGFQTAWNKGVPMAYRDNAQFNQEHVCPHCNKIGKGNAMFRYHMDKCKFKEASQ